MHEMNRKRRPNPAAALALGLLVALGGCGTDELEIPELDGPSELALSVRLTAQPDILTADGFSSSLIQATLRGPNGQPLAGRSVFMSITDAAGRTADIGQLRSTGSGGIGTGLVLVSGANGIAQAAYEAPVRTDFTSNGTVLVQARPIGDDFGGQVYRTVRIELRSAEPRLFPQPTAVSPPICGFTIEPSAGPYRVNTAVLFQSTSFDPLNADGTPSGILRYEWFFGDGTSSDHPDTAKVYRFPGTYVVTHVVTDNQGTRTACATAPPITVIP
jgi:hypothetical protein